MREYQKDKEVKKSELNEDFPATPMQTVKYVFALSVTVVLWSAGVYGLYNLMEFDRMLANTMEKACIRMNFTILKNTKRILLKLFLMPLQKKMQRKHNDRN